MPVESSRRDGPEQGEASTGSGEVGGQVACPLPSCDHCFFSLFLELKCNLHEIKIAILKCIIWRF